MKKISLVDIYTDYIKKEGTFNFDLDDLDRIGITGALMYFGLDPYVLTEEECDKILKRLRKMAEEVEFYREAQKEEE